MPTFPRHLPFPVPYRQGTPTNASPPNPPTGVRHQTDDQEKFRIKLGGRGRVEVKTKTLSDCIGDGAVLRLNRYQYF